MDIFQWALAFLQNMDTYLAQYFQEYGFIVYMALFLVIFCETGLVVTPFLPGDSLIFAAGTVAALGDSNIFALFAVMFAAAVLGNTVNYAIGHRVGQKIYDRESERFIKKKNIDDAMEFFERRGGVALVVTRFMPIMRTFTPFVAGIAKMRPAPFAFYNFTGAFLWIFLFLVTGYFFGSQPFVRKNLSAIMALIVVISICPLFIAKLNALYATRKIRR